MEDAINSVVDTLAALRQDRINIAVARKALDINQLQGGTVLRLLASAASATGKAVGKGTQFDAFA